MTRAVAVHHVVEGPADAPVLVLSNSLGSTLEMWDRQMAALTPHLRVIRYDLRGHGASPVPPAPYDIADLGADVLALLDELGVDRAHVGGLSIGGLIGMWIAANAPHRVDRLVVCSTSPRFEPPEAWAARAATVLAEGTGAVADAVVARWFTPAFADEFPVVVREMRDMIAEHASRRLRRVLRRRRADGPPPEPALDRGSDARDRRAPTTPPPHRRRPS